jgi:hypothetical protein
MGIRFACHHCGHPLNIKQELAGRVGRCPDCEQRFRIPLEDAPQSLPISATAGEGTSDSVTDLAWRGDTREPVTPEAVPAKGSATTLAAALTNATQWYVRPPAGGQYGPADDELIKNWIAEYRITPSTLVWRDGWPQWKNASEVFPELTDAAARSRPPTSNAVSGKASLDELAVATAAAPAMVGDAAIGQKRSARKRRRLQLVIGLAAIVCCLIGALILLWLFR